jgi:hypothetical protein
MKTSKKYSGSEHGIIAVMVAVCLVQPALGGTQGSYMNSRGDGKAVDSIKFVTATGTVLTSTATSPYTLGSAGGPCARVNPNEAPPFPTVCNNIASLLPGIPEKAYCQSKGSPNYVWSIQAYVTGGATADNPELENFLRINPANCASISVATSASFNDALSGQITVDADATDGAGFRLRGFEFQPGQQPQDLVDLKENGELRFDFSLPGPFVLNTENCTALTIPFSTQTGHENLYFVVDTVALSNPFEVICPDDVVYECGDAVVYPQVQVIGGCGDLSVSYDPPAAELPPGATTVTVTVTDEAENTTSCQFTAVREALVFDGFYAPLNGVGGTCGSPLRTINRGSTVPIKFRTTCNGSTYASGIPPTFEVFRCSNGQRIAQGNVMLVANEWHGNWDTSGLTKGDYLLIVTLQDGSEKSVSIRLK